MLLVAGFVGSCWQCLTVFALSHSYYHGFIFTCIAFLHYLVLKLSCWFKHDWLLIKYLYFDWYKMQKKTDLALCGNCSFFVNRCYCWAGEKRMFRKCLHNKLLIASSHYSSHILSRVISHLYIWAVKCWGFLWLCLLCLNWEQLLIKTSTVCP